MIGISALRYISLLDDFPSNLLMKIFRAFFLTLLFGAGSGWTENIRAVTLLIIEVWFGEGFKGDGNYGVIGEGVEVTVSVPPPPFFVWYVLHPAIWVSTFVITHIN